jgi:hypothetical protein
MNQYKYYSFTVTEGKNVVNVSFHLDSMHGDADLYISRHDRFPSKVDYEMSSKKSLTFIPDEIVYAVSDY